MTVEEKDLLLKDLCSRLPYGVKCTFNGKNIYKVYGIDEVVNDDGDWEYAICTKRTSPLYISDCKPYLFPLSSMTDEQREEFVKFADYQPKLEDCGRHQELYYYDLVGYENNLYPNSNAIDWCNKNHFDYRGLIPMDLANDATGLNIY